MMSDLIDRQAAVEALKKAYWDANIQSAKDDPCVIDAMTDWAIRQIKEVPSAQPKRRPYHEEWVSALRTLPEIIRCGECKYYTPVTAHCEIKGKGLYLIRGMEDFCSRAERRTDE